MTRDEFQKKYHEYMTQDKQEAEKECAKAQSEIEPGVKIVVQGFAGMGYCLMLKTAADAILDFFPGTELKE